MSKPRICVLALRGGGGQMVVGVHFILVDFIVIVLGIAC